MSSKPKQGILAKNNVQFKLGHKVKLHLPALRYEELLICKTFLKWKHGKEESTAVISETHQHTVALAVITKTGFQQLHNRKQQNCDCN